MYDIYHIEERLQEVDPNILRIDFDPDTLRHEIVARDKANNEYVAMTVPLGKLDARVVERVKEIDPRRGYNPFDDIEKWMNDKERRENRRIEDMARDMADNVYDSFKFKPSRSID